MGTMEANAQTNSGTFLVEGLLRARDWVPGWLIQAGLRLYLEVDHHVESMRGVLSTVPALETAEIAEFSRELMRVHYDMPEPLFVHMLGPTMKYSMALWDRGARTLEEAQSDMLADACDKAGVQDGDTVLDLGCGFGSLAAYVLEKFPRAKVTGLTLSRTQAGYIRERQAQAGHVLNTPRFELVEGDFNEVDFSARFDRVLSLGVFEHISNLTAALAKVRRFLRPEGTLFLHYIVYLPARAGETAVRQNSFIQRHIFPGGRVYAFNELDRHPEDCGLRASWYLPGTNYKRTLDCWLGNFLQHRAAIAREAGLDKRTMRLWELYLRASEANFAAAGGWAFGNGQYLLEGK
jgi:cyclopropane-fatty-acyl-phospholipid synthase